MNIDNLKVPVTKTVEKEVDGKKVYEKVTELELFDPNGQSDGSKYFMPEKLTSDDHEHNFVLKNSSDRTVLCECGFGGDVFPHTTVIKDGHIFDLQGNKVI